MTWWMWAMVAWATVASVAALWLAVTVYTERSGERLSPSSDPIDLPWMANAAAEDGPLFHFDPRAIAVSLRARTLGRP
jgi:hypothetical protein